MSTPKGDDQSRATRQPKKEESCTYPEQTNTKLTAGKLKDVRSMTADDRKQLAVQFSLIEEVALCLVYKDGSTQLRPKMVSIVQNALWYLLSLRLFGYYVQCHYLYCNCKINV